jgi:shikimate kinase
MRGVGKSNISRRLVFLTKRPVLSTDLLVEYETGYTIPEYVADHGWGSFRMRNSP